MTAKRLIIFWIFGAMLICLWAPLSSGALQRTKPQQKPAKPQEKIFIPKEVKSVLEEGLLTRESRKDIPVSIFYSLYLPARENFHTVFFMKIKNLDLGFTPVGAVTPQTSETPLSSGPSLQEAVAQEVTQLQASFNVFLDFNRFEETELKPFKEVYVPASIQVESAGFDPDKEETYTVGYPLPAGRYLLALAVTSLDLQKIGTAYYEFDIPNPTAFTKALGTTPVFFLKDYKQMEGPETMARVHKGSFTYSILDIIPNLDKAFAVGENLDVFFYIFGAQPNEQQKFDIDINFEVKKGEEFAIRWTPQKYETPLISQPLPLKQTVQIKSGEEVRTEQRDLAPGLYTLVINITDNVSQRSGITTVDFEVK